MEREIRIARAETARVALRALESDASSSLTLREEYQARLRSGENQSAGAALETSSSVMVLERRVVVAAEAVLDEDRGHVTRERGRIGGGGR